MAVMMMNITMIMILLYNNNDHLYHHHCHHVIIIIILSTKYQRHFVILSTFLYRRRHDWLMWFGFFLASFGMELWKLWMENGKKWELTEILSNQDELIFGVAMKGVICEWTKIQLQGFISTNLCYYDACKLIQRWTCLYCILNYK